MKRTMSYEDWTSSCLKKNVGKGGQLFHLLAEIWKIYFRRLYILHTGTLFSRDCFAIWCDFTNLNEKRTDLKIWVSDLADALNFQCMDLKCICLHTALAKLLDVYYLSTEHCSPYFQFAKIKKNKLMAKQWNFYHWWSATTEMSNSFWAGT